MPRYEVTLFTHVARSYIVEDDDQDAAIAQAKRQWAEMGEEGEVLYDDVEFEDVKLLEEKEVENV